MPDNPAPDVPIWISPKRAREAIEALHAATSLLTWTTVNAECLPADQHQNLDLVNDFVVGINRSILHALQRATREAKQMQVKHVTDKDRDSGKSN